MHRLLTNNGLCFLVRSQTSKHSVPDMVAPGPFTEGYLGHEGRFYPMGLFADRAAFGERADVGGNSLHSRLQIAKRFIVKACAHVPGVLELFMFVVITQQQ